MNLTNQKNEKCILFHLKVFEFSFSIIKLKNNMVRGKAVTKKTAVSKSTKKTKKVVEDEETDYNSLNVTQLKELLKERSLSTAGNKAALVARLEGEEAEEAPPKKAKGKSKAKKPVVESEEEVSEEEEPAPKKKTTKKPAKKPVESEDEASSEEPQPKKKAVKKSTKKPVEESEDEASSEEKPAPKKKTAKKPTKKPVEESEDEASSEEAPAPKKKVVKKTTKKPVEESEESSSEEPAPKKKGKAKKVKFSEEEVSESEEKPAPKRASKKKVEEEQPSEENNESDEDDEEEPLSLPSGVVVPSVTYNVPAQQLFEAVFQANEESSDAEGLFKVLSKLLEKHGRAQNEKVAPQTVKPKAKPVAEKKTPSKSPTKKPLEVSFNDKLQVYVDKSETWAFDSTTGSVFARVEADELTPLDENDLVELDKLRLKNHGILEDDEIASIVSQITAPQVGKDKEEASEGSDDGKDAPDDADVVEEEIGDAEMDISEETFVAYKLAQRASSNPADFVAIADAANIDEASAQYIMLHDKSLSNKYSQALAAASAKKSTGVPPKAPGTATGKPRRRLISKEE